MSLRLLLVGLITSALVGTVYVLTEPMIAESKETARQAALYALAEPLLRKGELQSPQTLSLPSPRPESLSENLTITPIANQNQTLGVIIPLQTGNGYNGTIRFLLALDTDRRIVGFRVVEHHETPGLGDQIETNKSDWMLQFSGLKYTDLSADDWAVTPDGGVFDAFTGATITPRATVNALAETLAYFEANPTRLEIQ
jgi:electron transport complex protein RnfG